MKLIIVTALCFVLVAILIYVATELVPRWLFLRRHKVHKDTFKQFDLTDENDRPE